MVVSIHVIRLEVTAMGLKRTVVHVVLALVRVIRIIDDKRATKTIAVLGGIMRMVPEGSSLVPAFEGVQEGIT